MALVVALMASLVVMVDAPAFADHTVDQQLTKRDASHPDCNARDLPGTVALESPLRQSFKPSRAGLAKVEVCLEVLVAGSVTFNLYERGDDEDPAENPGPRIGSATRQVTVNGLGSQWLAIDDLAVATTPGETFVMELVGGEVSARWRASCEGGLLGGSCPEDSFDFYDRGATNSGLGDDADFGFRTTPPNDADLVGEIREAPGVVCPGLPLDGRVDAFVTNIHDAESEGAGVGSFDVAYYLSDDEVLDTASDIELPGSRVRVDGLGAGETADVPPPNGARIPDGAASGRAFLLQVVDAENEVTEGTKPPEPGAPPDPAEKNNVVAHPTAVTGCGKAEASNLALEAGDPAEVTAGLRTLPLDLMPPETLAETSGLRHGGLRYGGLRYGDINFGGLRHGGLRYGGLRYGDINFGGLRYGGLRYGGLRHGGIGQHDLQTLLRQVPDPVLGASLLIDVPGPDWRTLFPDGPIQDKTLRDVRDQDLAEPLEVGDVDLSQVIELTWFAMAYSTTTLSAMGVDCEFLATQDFGCGPPGPDLRHSIDPDTDTLVTIDALGFPMDSLGEPDRHGSALSDVTLSDTAPFLVGPLTGEGRYVLETSPFGPLRLNPDHGDMTDPGAVVDCEAQEGLCENGTLNDAVSAGAVLPVTMATLEGQLTDTARQDILLHDAVNGLRPVDDWPWLPALLELDHASLAAEHPDAVDACQDTVPYRLTGTSSGTSAANQPIAMVDATFDVALGWTSRYIPGSGQLLVDGDTTDVEPSLEIDDEGRQHLEFETTALITGDFDLSFDACGGLVLGPWAAEASVRGTDTTGTWEFPGADQDPVTADVTTSQRGEPDDCDNALTVEPGELVVGHLDGSDDVDCIRVPVQSGTTRFIMQPPPQVDYDVTAFGPSEDPLDTAGLRHGGLRHGGLRHGGALDPLQPVPDGGAPEGADRGTIHTDSLQDAGLRHGPTDSSGVEAISHLRGDAVEVIELDAQEGEDGFYSFAVSPFGGTSPLPFAASVEHDPDDTVLPACNAAPMQLGAVRGTAPDLTGVTSPETLILVNRLALGEHDGAAAAASAITALEELAAFETDDDNDGEVDFAVDGIVLEVDSDAAVHAADRTWRTGENWCSVVAANDVAVSIRDLVASYREQYPSIRNVVVAGPDTTLPGLRVPDDATLASQESYLDDVLDATEGNNPLVAAVAADTYVVDAALAGSPTTPWMNTGLYLPGDVSLSRLVETAGDIEAAAVQYIGSRGLVDISSAFTSAYEFMEDGAEEAAKVLEGQHVDVTELFGDEWGALEQAAGLEQGDQQGDPFPFLRLDGHSDHFQQLSAHGSSNEQYDDVNDTRILKDLPPGGIVLSLGCNFGVNVPDILTDGGGEDWMQAVGQRRAVAFANTGYGYGDDETLALDERLLLDLTERFYTTENVGHALTEAKHEYIATMGAYGGHDKKAVETMTNFGLGLYRFADADPNADPDPEPTDPGQHPGTGLRTATVSGSYTVLDADDGTCASGACLARRTDGEGATYYEVEGEPDSVPLAVSDQFLTPQSNTTLNVPGFRPGGVWFTERTTEVRTVDAAAVAHATVSDDRASHIADRAFPVTPGEARESLRHLQTVNVPLAFTRTNGRVDPNDPDADPDKATVVLTTSYEAQVFQVPNGDGDEPVALDTPRIGRSQVALTASGIAFSVEARTDQHDVIACQALVVAPSGETHIVALEPSSRSTDETCTGFLPDVHDAFFVQYQVLNEVGAVGNGALKGLDPLELETSENGIQFEKDPAQPDGDNGWYVSPVQVAITGPQGIPLTVYVDGSELAGFSGAVPVTGTGVHELVVTGEGAFGHTSIPVDTDDPACTGLPSGTFPAATVIEADWTCTDVGSGVSVEAATFDGATVEKGDEIDLAKIGTYEFRVVVQDFAGRSGIYTSEIVVEPTHTFKGFFEPIDNGGLNRISAGETVPFKFQVFLLDDSGDPGTEVTSTDAVELPPTWTQVRCDDPDDVIDEDDTDDEALSSEEFRYHEKDGFFTYHAKTYRSWDEGDCFRFTVELQDGSTLSATLQVT